jgi:predicted O-methyltransferase YrrM
MRFPPRVVEYIRTYDPATGGYADPSSGLPVDFASVELEVGMLWHALVMLLRPSRVLETGTYRGFSTCCIAAAMETLGTREGGDRSIITIDPQPRDHLWLGTPLAAHIEYIPAKSQDAAPRVNGREFDMLVLDSDHHYATIMRELILFEPLLVAGGTILLHDSLYFDGVGLAVRQLRANPRFETLTLDSPRTHGVAGCRPPGVTLIRKLRSGDPALDFQERLADVFVGNRLDTPILHADERPAR